MVRVFPKRVPTSAWPVWVILVLIGLGVVVPMESEAGIDSPCIGDIDGDGVVGIDELIRGVNFALQPASPGTRAAFDRDRNGTIEISELVAAVLNALEGCPPTPTVTPDTLTPTPTLTATFTPEAVLEGHFERSTAFDSVVASIPLPFGDASVTSAMSLDIDADDLLDVLVAVGQNGAHRETWLIRQTASDVWAEPSLVPFLGGPRAVTDLNGDGALDLIVADRLGVVWGDPSGLDLNAVRSLPGADPNPQRNSFNSSIVPIDLDRDGLTDLALAAFGGIDRILYQEANDTFSELWLDPGLSFAFCPVDFNDDGIPDLLSMTDGVYQEGVNEGGAWVQTEPRLWVRSIPADWPEDQYLAPKVDMKGTPMGCAWGNLDGDDDLELWLSQVSSATPIYDRRGASWVDVGRTLKGIANQPFNEFQGFEVFWGVAIVDFDGDGRDDIAVAGGNGLGYGDLGISHLGLFVGTSAGFIEQGRRLGLGEPGDFQSLIADDIDGDGLPDLLVGQFAGLPRLYLNRLVPRGGTIALELRGPAAENVQIDFIGSAERWTMRTGMQAQSLVGSRPVVFRGVGDERELQLRVHWPQQVTEVMVEPRAEPWIIFSPSLQGAE